MFTHKFTLMFTHRKILHPSQPSAHICDCYLITRYIVSLLGIKLKTTGPVARMGVDLAPYQYRVNILGIFFEVVNVTI